MAITFRHLEDRKGTMCIAGSRLRVYTIQGLRRSGDTPEEIAQDYRIPLGAVYEALAYAADHPDEMDEIRKAEDQTVQEILDTVPEELRRGADLPG
jgi:uncharacterized protein (DUF433 family)